MNLNKDVLYTSAGFARARNMTLTQQRSFAHVEAAFPGNSRVHEALEFWSKPRMIDAVERYRELYWFLNPRQWATYQIFLFVCRDL